MTPLFRFMKKSLFAFTFFPFALAAVMLLSACSAAKQPLQRHDISDLGWFEFRAPELRMRGVVVGAPHGASALGSAALALEVSEQSGSGVVAAFGFKSKRVTVAQPLVMTGLYTPLPTDPAKRGSVFREYKKIVRDLTDGEIGLYVDFRGRPAKNGMNRIQVVSGGFTFDQLQFIKRSYGQVQERVLGSQAVERVPMAISPLEEISWEPSGIRDHGVLMIAERALSVRLPEKLFSGTVRRVYAAIFATWVEDVVRMIRENPRGLEQFEVKVMDLGRFDLFRPGNTTKGIVIGSPHGSYDEYTAELVEHMSHEINLPAVVARGFTPTEAGGWRINVNRPSEKTYLAPEFEINSQRSKDVYRAYRELVLKAAGGHLALYFDIHQYGGRRIQVATVGISAEEAKAVKKNYLSLRKGFLAPHPDIDVVEFLIEPLDNIEIGAWATKAHGILSVANKGLHFELPLYSFFRTQKSREVYARILTELLKQIAAAPSFSNLR